MSPACPCGAPAPQPSERLGCLQCGRPCCPACGYVLESAWYCTGCAEALVGTRVAPGAAPRDVI
jgi:hypothetical protein